MSRGEAIKDGMPLHCADACGHMWFSGGLRFTFIDPFMTEVGEWPPKGIVYKEKYNRKEYRQPNRSKHILLIKGDEKKCFERKQDAVKFLHSSSRYLTRACIYRFPIKG